MAGKKILTQFALPVGSTSGSFGSGSAGQVLTSGGSSSSMYWGSGSGVGKYTYEFGWNQNSPPTGCSFVNTNATNDTVRLVHSFGRICVVNLIDVDDYLGAGAYYGADMGADISVIHNNNSVDLIISDVSGGIPSTSDDFKVIIIG